MISCLLPRWSGSPDVCLIPLAQLEMTARQVGTRVINRVHPGACYEGPARLLHERVNTCPSGTRGSPHMSLSPLQNSGSQSHKSCTARGRIVLMSFGPNSSWMVSPGEQGLFCLLPPLHGNSAVTYPRELGFPPKSLTLNWRNGEKAKVRDRPEEVPGRGIAEALLIIGGHTCPSLAHLSWGQIIMAHSR